MIVNAEEVISANQVSAFHGIAQHSIDSMTDPEYSADRPGLCAQPDGFQTGYCFRTNKDNGEGCFDALQCKVSRVPRWLINRIRVSESLAYEVIRASSVRVMVNALQALLLLEPENHLEPIAATTLNVTRVRTIRFTERASYRRRA